jgi:hypothetical protein
MCSPSVSLLTDTLAVVGRSPVALAHENLHELSDDQRRQVAAGLNQILVELGKPRQEISDWWNLIAFSHLGGRTPTQAWLAGDYEEVRDLVRSMYEDSADSALRLKQSASFAELVDRDRESRSGK